MREFTEIRPHAFSRRGAQARIRSRLALIGALALAGVATPLLAGGARAAPADDAAARLAAVERENALLRREIAALRERAQLQAQKRELQGRVEPPRAAPEPSGPYATAAPVLKAAPAPAPAYGWTGFYVGANIGLGVARNPTGAPVLEPAVPTGIFSNEQLNLSPLGVIGGAQAGYNWQPWRDWVLGIEADIQGSGQVDNKSCIDFCGVTAFGEAFNQRIDWFGTLRGRVGWTSGPALFYLTGGGAFGQATTTLTFTSNGAGVFAGTFAQTKTGWTVGAGIEAQLAGNWTAKAEYLYMDLGSVSGLVSTSFGEPFTFSSRLQDHIGRFGVNYKFGAPVYAVADAPLFYKATPASVADWSGIYVGANLGASVARSPSEDTQSSPALGLISHDSVFTSPIGVIGGGQIGVNWQPARSWVLGLETDFQGSSERDSTTCIFQCSALPAPLVSLNETIREQIKWFGTARGRIGWTDGPLLLYATGGFAYGRVSASLDSLWTNNAGLTVTSHDAVTAVRAGWTAGGGVEAKVAGNWSAKAEYLFVDLGTIGMSAVSAGNFALQAGRTFAFSSDVQDHIFRLGVNYRVR